MKLFNNNDNIENILNEYYKTKENHLKNNIPDLSAINIVKMNTGSSRRFLINTAFTCGIIIMSGLFLLTAGDQSELATVMETVIENTNVIEHIISGSINMFEILSKSFM